MYREDMSSISNYRHGRLTRTGVLLVNLGTPDAATPAAVRKFLAEFLSDPRVIEAPRWLWLPLLHGAILQIRPRLSAAAYRQIWTDAGSPLLVNSKNIAAALAQSLQARLHGPLAVPLAHASATPTIPVVLGMTYGNPSIAAALQILQSAQAERILVLPLFPQYSATSTASVFDRVTMELRRWRWVPELRFVNHYYDEPAYVEALARRIAAHWEFKAARSFLLFSFHGIPKSYVMAGDPYYCQSLNTARRVAERLQLTANEWSVGFQSRVGRAEWIGPYTEEVLRQRAADGLHDVAVICPGFATDCLETLEEIAIRYRDSFLDAGGASYSYIPALNSDPDHIELLTEVVERHIQGWPLARTENQSENPAEDAARQQVLQRALSKGALR